MKNVLVLLCLCVTSLTYAQSFTSTPIWSDEFNGTGAPDLTKWGYETGYKRNDELQYFTNSINNIRQNNGNLEITVRPEIVQGTKNGTPTTFSYTSGSITTAYKNDWLYGKIVGRFKIPQGKGLWACFWTLGANFEQQYWPKCGEIDIFEHIDSEGLVHTTVHYDDPSRPDPHAVSGGSTFNFDVTQFHDYSIEWTPASIKWFVDGVQVKEFSILNSVNSTEEYHRSQYILVNLPIGGNWPQKPDASTPLPATMYCDWIRVYGYVPPNSQAGNQYINSGGSESGSFSPDKWYSTGWTASDYTKPIDVTGVTNPAPQAVYQSARQGDLTYTLSGLTPNTAYKTRLHFAEIQEKIWSYFVVGVGQRVFNVKVNNTPVLTNFDIFAQTGGLYKAFVKEVTATSDASGNIAVQLISVSGEGKAQINGIEVSTLTTQVTGVAISPISANIEIGSTVNLTATVTPSTATNKTVSWSSSNPSVATVTSTGEVRGVASGTATITATTQDGGKTATSAITVSNNVLTIYEAELGTLNASAVVVTRTNASNAKAVADFTLINSFSKISNVNGYGGGSATLRIRYSNGTATNSSLSLHINGVFVNVVTFPPTGSSNTFTEVTQTITLPAGRANAIKLQRLANDVAGAEIDKYTVIIANNNGARLAVETFIPESTSDLPPRVIVYPNPATERVTLDLRRFKENDQLDIRLIDSKGNVVFTKATTGGELLPIKFDKQIEHGLYLLNIQSATESITQKVIIDN